MSCIEDVDFTDTDNVVDETTSDDGGNGDTITSSVASDAEPHKNLQEQLKGIGVGKKITFLSTYDKNGTANRIWAQMFKQEIVGVVPLPRDSQSSNYSVFGPIKGFAVPSGSKETELAMNFIKMLKASNKYDLQYETISTKTSKVAVEAQEIRRLIRDEFNIVPCISLGIKEIHSIMWGGGEMGKGLSNPSMTWETIAASVAPQVQSILDKLG